MNEPSMTPKRTKSIALVVLTALIIAGACATAVWSMWPRKVNSGGPTEAYFTIDDGATFFADSGDLKPPFQKDGKVAVRAHVFMCGGKFVVGYLSRFTEDHLRAVQTTDSGPLWKNKRPPVSVENLRFMGPAGTEVKAPGAKAWVNGGTQEAGAIRTFKCADGTIPSSETYP